MNIFIRYVSNVILVGCSGWKDGIVVTIFQSTPEKWNMVTFLDKVHVVIEVNVLVTVEEARDLVN